MIEHNGRIVAVHIMLLDPPHRARLLISATSSREDAELGKVVGPMNRRLHWEEILYYKANGYAEYDFGGTWPDPKNPFHSIGKFKEAFGGDVKRLQNFDVIKNPLIRAGFRGARRVKQALARIKSKRPGSSEAAGDG